MATSTYKYIYIYFIFRKKMEHLIIDVIGPGGRTLNGTSHAMVVTNSAIDRIVIIPLVDLIKENVLSILRSQVFRKYEVPKSITGRAPKSNFSGCCKDMLEDGKTIADPLYIHVETLPKDFDWIEKLLFEFMDK